MFTRIIKYGLVAVIASVLTTAEAGPDRKPDKEKPKKESKVKPQVNPEDIDKILDIIEEMQGNLNWLNSKVERILNRMGLE